MPCSVCPIIRLVGGLVNLVEDAAITEMLRLCFRPSTKLRIINSDQLDVRQLLQQILRDNGRIGRTVEMLGRNVLSLVGIEILQVSLGSLAGALFIDILIDNGNRWFCKDRDGKLFTSLAAV